MAEAYCPQLLEVFLEAGFLVVLCGLELAVGFDDLLEWRDVARLALDLAAGEELDEVTVVRLTRQEVVEQDEGAARAEAGVDAAEQCPFGGVGERWWMA